MTTNDRVDRLETRIIALQRSVRRWRIAGCGLLVVGMLLAADAGPSVFDHLVVRKLDVIGAGDTPQVSIRPTEAGGRVDLYANDGTNLLRMSSNDSGADIALWSRSGASTAGIWSARRGGALGHWEAAGGERLRAADGQLTLKGSGTITLDAASGVLVEDGSSQASALVSADAGLSSMELRSGDGTPVMAISTDGGGRVQVANTSGEVIAEIRALPGIGGGVVLQTATGKRMVLLAATTDGGRLNLMNSHGVPVVIASPTEGGDGAISVVNERGIPVATMQGDTTHRGELVISDQDGANTRRVRPMRGYSP